MPTPAATTGPGPPIPPTWWTASSPPARDATSSTSGAAPASPPGCSRRPAAGCSAWSPTRGWPSWPGRAGPRSRSRSSRTGTRRPHVRRGHRRAGLALGGAGRGHGQGRRGAAPRRPAGGVLERLRPAGGPARGVRRGIPPGAPGLAVRRFWDRPAVDAYRAGCARVADVIRQTGAFGEPEEWLSYWERPYTRDGVAGPGRDHRRLHPAPRGHPAGTPRRPRRRRRRGRRRLHHVRHDGRRHRRPASRLSAGVSGRRPAGPVPGIASGAPRHPLQPRPPITSHGRSSPEPMSVAL